MTDTDDIKACLRTRIATIEKQQNPQKMSRETSSNNEVRADSSFAEKSQDELAFQKIIRLVSVREHACETLRQRLSREGFDKRAIERALDRALSLGLVDDKRYAEAFLHKRLKQGHGVQGIVAELANCNIDVNAFPEWFEDFSYDSDTEIERALQVLTQKPPHARNKREAAYRRLVQKGFDSLTAASAARQWSESLTEE